MKTIVGVLTVVLGLAVQAEVTTKAATARLKQIGFKDTSYLLNAEGTFSDVLSGDYNLEVNDTATGGAIVTLGSQANTYTGGTYVRCGTLVVPSAASLGSTTAPIVLGSGTIRFTEDMELTRNFTALPADVDLDVSTLKHGQAMPIVSVDAGKVVSTTGKFYREDSATGYDRNVVKRGAGTFVYKSTAAGYLGQNSGTLCDWSWSGALVTFPANGDSPRMLGGSSGTTFYNDWGFAVFDGTFKIDTPAAVKTYLTKFCVGGVTTLDGTETAGHFEVANGTVTSGNVWLGNYNGNKTTAPGGLASSFTVSGGEMKVNGNFFMGYTGFANDGSTWDATNGTSRAKLNVSGGKLTITGNLSFGTPFGLETGKNKETITSDPGKITLSGGEMTVNNIVCGESGYGQYGQKVVVNMSNSAKLTVTDTFYVQKDKSEKSKTTQYGNVFTAQSHVISVTDGAQFAIKNFKDVGNSWYSYVFVDVGSGGTFKWLKSSESELYSGGSGGFRIVSGGATFDISDFDAGSVTPRVKMPIFCRDTSKRSSSVLTVTGSGRALCLDATKTKDAIFNTAESRILLGKSESFTSADFTISGDGAIGACGWTDTAKHTVTVKSLAFGATGTLEVGHATGDADKAPSLLVANAFTPPTEELRVTTYADTGTAMAYKDVPVGTFAILKYPSSVSFDAAKCRYAGTLRGYHHTFSTETSGSWTTLKMTVEKSGLVLFFR